MVVKREVVGQQKKVSTLVRALPPEYFDIAEEELMRHVNIAHGAIGRSISLGYHTPMWFDGTYNEGDADGIPSTRLLFKYATRYS